MNIESAKYISKVIDYDKGTKENFTIEAVIDGETMFIPLDPDNRHYAAILEWAKEDSNEIAEAD
jgi:hypothetical protein|tara:strand:- start:144 stop:335 length:192 start_codon:yes stop_codon:yes gene_type:complete